MKLIQEAELNQVYQHSIQRFWLKHMCLGQFAGADCVAIQYAYVLHPEAKGSVVISSGRIEGLVKYKELVFNLYHNGYSVFIHDHRGQGQSGRMTANSQRGYVEDFDDYVADLKAFYLRVVSPNTRHQPYLLCHSMGCAIGALYVLDNPLDFAKVAFSSPMFGIPIPIPQWLLEPLLKVHQGVNRLFSDQPWYFLGQKHYAPASFEQNELTHSETRYKLFRQEYAAQPENKLGGVTASWLAAALQAMDQIEARADSFAIPALLLQAGADTVVDNLRQDRVAGRFPQYRKVELPTAKHELLMEKDEIRNRCVTQILTFFADG